MGSRCPPGIDAARFLEVARPTELDGYGLGIRRNGDCYYHSGTFAGYLTVAFHCEDRDVTGALFANSSLPEHDEAMAALGDELMAAPPGR
ncbi:MAG: hypothetical protein ABI895_08890 [Deltaproteobacteria bacterium]